MNKLKSYFRIHLSYWHCYISVLVLGGFIMMWGPLVIWVFHTVVGVPYLVMLGGVIVASPLCIPNYAFTKEYGLNKIQSLLLTLILQLITTAIIIFISYLILFLIYGIS